MEQPLPRHDDAIRHLCQESSCVLSSLRTGPPAVAHGDVVHDLRSLRKELKAQHLTLEDASLSENGIGPVPESSAGESVRSEVEVDVDEGESLIWTIRPFLAVIMDPMCSGRHTLCALRAVHRVLERGTLVSLVKFKCNSNVKVLSLDAIATAVLDCKFEQTDISGDEAVEMALADLLGLLIVLDSAKLMSMESNTTGSVVTHSAGPMTCAHDFISPLQSKTRMNAFTTVFVARNTFIHSPALCYHVEGVLQDMVSVTFRYCLSGQRTIAIEDAARTMLEFLTQQLLHTPLNMKNSDTLVVNEAQVLHDATRVLCLKLTRCLIREGWGSSMLDKSDQWKRKHHQNENSRPLLGIIQDELCLALLIIGQAAGSEVLSLEVLSEICSTILCLWGTSSFLRQSLSLQFEAIISGFFIRTLSQLRQRPIPTDSNEFTRNQSFDAECEIILETLVDIMCLKDESNVSTLEIMFLAYDCNLNSSNIVVGLVDELSRCCADFRRESVYCQIPSHLRDLCAEALTIGLKCMLHDLSSINTKSSEKSVLHAMKLKKSTLLQGAILFNEKSSKGIQFLIDHKVIDCAPKDVALFLRQGITLGLSKIGVGAYLGEKGKGTTPLKSVPDYERDWFHDKVLQEYCSLFYFEAQPLLDGLRMFLSSFRLPGEAQQIDRIIQAFAESCGGQCKETVELNLFSESKKKAADATYLLAFSIIMLNTDLHNPNIRPDRKMSLDAFFRNNTDYGREITDEGKALPREFLESIYESIRLEEIRTEGEGAEGVMTVDQWNDVVIGRRGGLRTSDYHFIQHQYSLYPREVKELVIEHIWKHVLNAIEEFWKKNEVGGNGMLGAQEAKLGMDLALEILNGLYEIGNEEIFNIVFVKISELSGLLQYSVNENERRNNLIYSVQKQGAVTCVMNIARKAGNFIDSNGWKAVYSILFELRDLKLLHSYCLNESDSDFLTRTTRDEWNKKLDSLHNGAMQIEDAQNSSGVLDIVFGGLFSTSTHDISAVDDNGVDNDLVNSIHGKERNILWDERAESDNEVDDEDNIVAFSNSNISIGTQFERMLLHEDHFIYFQTSTNRNKAPISQRARVRRRLAATCDFDGLLSESKYFKVDCIRNQLRALIDLINGVGASVNLIDSFPVEAESTDDCISSFEISPASEAYAEILITEIILKNRDRLSQLWDVLHAHYLNRLKVQEGMIHENEFALFTPGIEKCCVGLLRICSKAIQRENVTDDMIEYLKLLTSQQYSHFAIHFAEGCWRMCTASCDGLKKLSKASWIILFSLLEFCIISSAETMQGTSIKLDADDPALISFRSLHILLHSPELKSSIPFEVVKTIETLIQCGEERCHSQLAVASLDLLLVLHSRLGNLMTDRGDKRKSDILVNFWISVLDSMKEASRRSPFTTVRQHALSMLTDAIIDSHGKLIPQHEIYRLLNTYCIELSIERISTLINSEEMELHVNDVNTELDLCLSLIFKPFLHHLHVQNLASNKEQFELLWYKLLKSVTILLEDETFKDDGTPIDRDHHDSTILRQVRRQRLLEPTRQGVTERLQNIIMVLIGYNILQRSDVEHATGSISDKTWKLIRSLKICCSRIDEWVLLDSETNKEVPNTNSNLVAQ